MSTKNFGPMEALAAQSVRDKGPAAIEVSDLVKTYSAPGGRAAGLVKLLRNFSGKPDSRTTALKGVNLTVQPGEVFGLLGPNGAGKTTLIKILSTLVLPDSGLVKVFGIDVVQKPRASLKLLQTVLAQNTGFEPRLSARRNLEFYAALYGIPKDSVKETIAEAVEFTGLSDKMDIMFQKFSTGMARRLLVARALLSNASILVFDEPTSSLDPSSATEFRRLLREDLAKKKRKTVFLATHNLHEAQQICDKVALIRKGIIIASGTPEKIRRAVTNTANLSISLIGIPPTSKTELVTLLKSVEGLSSVTTQDVGSESRFTIEGTKDLDYARVLEILGHRGARITALEATEPSLEDAFLSIVGDRKD